MDRHPLEDFMHPDMHAFVAADPQAKGHHGVIADWLEEKGHPVLAQVFRRHQPFQKIQFGRYGGEHLLPGMVSEFEHQLSTHVDHRGKTTELTYHRMRDQLTGKKFHAVNLTHWRWWNPDPEGMNTGHAVSVTAPVTRRELSALIKQYGHKGRKQTARHQLRNPEVAEFPVEHVDHPDAQLAAQDIGGPQAPVASPTPAAPRPLRGGLARPAAQVPHALPSRQSVGISDRLPEPQGGVQHSFANGHPVVKDEQGNTFIHRPARDPARFQTHMQQLGTPESLHMRRAAETGHRWNVAAGDYQHFAKYDPAALAKMSGAVPGDTVGFHVNPRDGTHVIQVKGAGEHAGKTVNTVIDHRKGDLYLDTIVGPGQGGQGWGGRYFFDALRGARRLGLKTITAGHAIGEPGDRMWNGYYSWPRLGFNGPLPEGHKLPREHADAKDFHELFARPGGAEAWKRHGTSSFNIQFDTSKGSPHVQRLVQYLRGVAARRRGAGPTQLAREDWRLVGTTTHRIASRMLPGGVNFRAFRQWNSHPDPEEWPWEVTFGRKPAGKDQEQTKLTGDTQGLQAVAIMRHVLHATKDFMHVIGPRKFSFSAAKSDVGRVKLYDRAAPILAEQHGYDHEREDGGDIIHYNFSKKAAPEGV